MSIARHSNKIERKARKLPSKRGIVAIERRKFPRFNLELPLDYVRIDDNGNYGGIVANASELGVLAYIPEKIRIGTILRTEIFYAKGLELDSIKSVAEVVWADLPARKTWGEHRYGLQFKSIDRKNLNKLRNLLKEAGKATNLKKEK